MHLQPQRSMSSWSHYYTTFLISFSAICCCIRAWCRCWRSFNYTPLAPAVCGTSFFFSYCFLSCLPTSGKTSAFFVWLFSYCEKLKGIRLAWKIVDKILNRLYTQLQRFALVGQIIPQSITLMRIDKFIPKEQGIYNWCRDYYWMPYLWMYSDSSACCLTIHLQWRTYLACKGGLGDQRDQSVTSILIYPQNQQCMDWFCCLSGASGELTRDMTTFSLLQLSAAGLPVLLPPAKAKLKSLFVLPFHTHGGFKHWISRGHNKVMTLLRYTATIFIVAICSVMVDARYGSGATLCCCSCRHKDCRSSTWWVRCSCGSCQKGRRSFTWWICCSHCDWNNDYRSYTWQVLPSDTEINLDTTRGAYGQQIKELEQIISWLDVSSELILSQRCSSCLIHVSVKWL